MAKTAFVHAKAFSTPTSPLRLIFSILYSVGTNPEVVYQKGTSKVHRTGSTFSDTACNLEGEKLITVR